MREQSGVDPKLNLHELRQYLFRVNRMLNMTKDGRAYYYRASVVVGNGRGLAGFGVSEDRAAPPSGATVASHLEHQSSRQNDSARAWRSSTRPSAFGSVYAPRADYVAQ